MLDIRFIRENKKIVAETIINKNSKLNLEHLLELDEKRRSLQIQVDGLREKRNQITEQLKMKGKDDKLIKNAKEVKEMLAELTERQRLVNEEFNQLMLLVPNIPAEDTPIGKDESKNIEIKKVGEPKKFKFKIKDHIELGKNLNILDIERGVKVAGFRGYFLKNEGALLHLAILNFALKKLMEKGFTPMITPTLAKDEFLYGTGWFPFDMDNIYKVLPAGKINLDKAKEEGLNLIGTAEVSLCGYYSNEILKEEDLPIKICGYSQCYRSEIGSYGKDTKGIYRVREFTKVEQVILCKNDIEESEKWHQELMKISEEILEELELPYRVIRQCTGDMGQGKYKMFDIETWMPSKNAYGETHSASNLTDWQARRLNIKYRNKKGDVHYVHMLNNTAIASPRILIALIENNQNEDGSVNVPKVLQEYVGKEKIQ